MSIPANKIKFRAMGSHVDLVPALMCSFFCAITTLFAPATLRAQGFSAVITPPRFEVAVQPGKTTRQVIEITHVANQGGKYRVYTNDWSLGPDGDAKFSEELAPNSCRPWVALERRDLSLAANGKIRFRFEISPPADAVSAECRFAIMIEGLEQVIKTEGPVSFPVSGRIAVIVYAVVGDARPKLEISHAGTGLNNGVFVPQLQVRNTGNAHGRLDGFVSGVDAQGRQIDFVPEALPILPAQSRVIALIPNVPGNGAVTLTYPLTVKGDLEWGDQKTGIDLRFEPPFAEKAPPSTNLPPTTKVPPLVPGPAAK
jgi:hypothetical protein